MKIIQPNVTVLPFDPMDMLLNIERAARLCYKSEGLIGYEPNLEFIQKRLDTKHLSVIEHEKISVIVVCDRGISHEIVRHRLAAYSQESTRYCNYSGDKFGNEITVIKPFFLPFNSNKINDIQLCSFWKNGCEQAEKNYFGMLANGATPQEARSVLPNSLKTEIFITYNLREWRHFFSLRADVAAHPQMRQIAIPLLLKFKELVPVIFDDIPYDTTFLSDNYAELIF